MVISLSDITHADIEFRCKKCGKCCKGLLNDDYGTNKGLTLTTNEAKLFPSELIAPQTAFGRNRPDTVVLYQLTVDVCPFFNETEKICRIYEKRPLICRVFPMSLALHYNANCTVFSFTGKLAPHMKLFIDWPDTHVEACQKLNSYVHSRFDKVFEKGIGTWAYDLESKQWKLMHRYFNECPKSIQF